MERRRWDKAREVVDLATGEVTRKFVLNTREGLLLTLHGGGRALQAERSLPKVHRGQNIDDLTGPAVAVAIAQVDAEIADALGYHDLPTFAEWLPVRADYPRTMRLSDDATVFRTLDKWAGIALPYKGLPVVGQSGSLTWSKGDIRLKAYSKSLESHDPRARGLLRIEPGVFRARTFRKLLGVSSDAPVNVLDVLSPVLFGKVHERFDARLRGDLMSAKELRDRDLFREVVQLFGARRAATLLGWALMWGMAGVNSREEMLAVGLGTMRTRYRVLADYRRLRDVLVEKGYSLSDTGEADDDVETIVHLVAEAA
jgi:hypothetical protein